jgi:hypothetical protein
LAHDDLNQVKLEKELQLKEIDQEFWTVRYGKLPQDGSDIRGQPSPKREIDEKNHLWEIKKLSGEMIIE